MRWGESRWERILRRTDHIQRRERWNEDCSRRGLLFLHRSHAWWRWLCRSSAQWCRYWSSTRMMKWSAERIIPTTDWRQVSWPKIVSAVNGRINKECLRSSSVSCIGIRWTIASWFGLGESIPSYSISSSFRWFQTIRPRSRTRSIRTRTVLWSENCINQIPLENLRLFYAASAFFPFFSICCTQLDDVNLSDSGACSEVCGIDQRWFDATQSIDIQVSHLQILSVLLGSQTIAGKGVNLLNLTFSSRLLWHHAARDSFSHLHYDSEFFVRTLSSTIAMTYILSRNVISSSKRKIRFLMTQSEREKQSGVWLTRARGRKRTHRRGNTRSWYTAILAFAYRCRWRCDSIIVV